MSELSIILDIGRDAGTVWDYMRRLGVVNVVDV
jgi:hypothetical protein